MQLKEQGCICSRIRMTKSFQKPAFWVTCNMWPLAGGQCHSPLNLKQCMHPFPMEKPKTDVLGYSSCLFSLEIWRYFTHPLDYLLQRSLNSEDCTLPSKLICAFYPQHIYKHNKDLLAISISNLCFTRLLSLQIMCTLYIHQIQKNNDPQWQHAIP